MKRKRPIYGHIIYTGFTNNIFRRLKEHLSGNGGFTKAFHGNIQLGYLEAYDDKTEALHREAVIKNKLKKWFGKEQEERYTRDDKVELIQQFEREHPEKIEFIMNRVKEKLL
jgi:predicted GIY-YIG superfamily endonuclease